MARRSGLAPTGLVAMLGLIAMASTWRSPRSVGPPSVQAGGPAPIKYRVLFNRFLAPEVGLFVSDADGHNERALQPVAEPAYSPFWSADGRWIVFTAEPGGQADIYRCHPDGTGLERLTDDPAFDDQAALSPDGKDLAFVSTRDGGFANIWLMNLASGVSREVTRTQAGNFRPSWSPDGQWLAFSSDRGAHPGAIEGRFQQLQSIGVYVVRIDGSGLRRLSREGGFAGSPVWGPDGESILFYETDEVGAFLAKDAESRTELVIVNVTTGARRLVTGSAETKLSPRWVPGGGISYISRAAGPSGGLRVRRAGRRFLTVVPGAVREPSWSPDAAYVVYERLRRLGSTERLQPTFSRDPQFELVLSEPFPTFSPDGRSLAYTEWGVEKSEPTGLDSSSVFGTSVEVMNADGSARRTIFHQDGVMAFDTEWSPVGDDVAVSVGPYFRSSAPARILAVKADGSATRTLVDDVSNDGFATWSPDGRRIAFRRGRQLVVRSLASGSEVALTDDAHFNNFPQWSPRGDWISFTSDRNGTFQIYAIRPNGTELRQLTHGDGPDAHSAFCSDGEWIVFSSGRLGFRDEQALYDSSPQPYGELFAMRSDGSDVRQLTDNKWEDATPACRPEAAH